MLMIKNSNNLKNNVLFAICSAAFLADKRILSGLFKNKEDHSVGYMAFSS